MDYSCKHRYDFGDGDILICELEEGHEGRHIAYVDMLGQSLQTYWYTGEEDSYVDE